MGILEKDKFHKVEPKKFKEKQIIFARSEYFSAKIEGKQFLQLGTFGEKGDNEG